MPAYYVLWRRWYDRKKNALSKLGEVLNNNKKEIISLGAGTIGGVSGLFIGYAAEEYSKSVNEEGEKIKGWWTRNTTYITSAFLGLGAFGYAMNHYGQEAGIEIGKKEEKEKQIERIKLKIEKLTTDNAMHDFVKKNLIESYENYIKEIEKEMQDEYKD